MIYQDSNEAKTAEDVEAEVKKEEEEEATPGDQGGSKFIWDGQKMMPDVIATRAKVLR